MGTRHARSLVARESWPPIGANDHPQRIPVSLFGGNHNVPPKILFMLGHTKNIHTRHVGTKKRYSLNDTRFLQRGNVRHLRDGKSGRLVALNHQGDRCLVHNLGFGLRNVLVVSYLAGIQADTGHSMGGMPSGIRLDQNLSPAQSVQSGGHTV